MMTKGQIIRYAVLPGIFPRLKLLFGSGFHSLARLLAIIFFSVRLLPPTHPYLNPVNYGRFGLRHVVWEAYKNLEFSRKNIDKIFIFFTISCGLAILFVQFLLLIFAFVSQPVFANQFAQILSNPSERYGSFGPQQDIAMMVLDRVFGVKGIFESCVSEAVPCLDMHENVIQASTQYPYPIHLALHQMLGFYSLGIGFISLMVILYHIVNIVGETATTGSPFGQRFNKAWAPVRFILFFALLAPLNIDSGHNAWLNGAQLITLWAAKLGSNVATNAWMNYNTSLSKNILGEGRELVARPNPPPLGYLLQFMTVAHACKSAYERQGGDLAGTKIHPYIVRSADWARTGGANYVEMMSTNFQGAVQFTNKGTIAIRFGYIVQPKAGEAIRTTYKANINPLCGELSLVLGDITQPGTLAMTEYYYELVRGLYNTQGGGGGGDEALGSVISEFSRCLVNRHMPYNVVTPECNPLGVDTGSGNRSYVNILNYTIQNNVVPLFNLAFSIQEDLGVYEVPEGLLKKGWAGAAMWYNTIAEMNGAMTMAVLNAPTIYAYPELMHKVEEMNQANTEAELGTERFDPSKGGTANVTFDSEEEGDIAKALNAAYRVFEDYDVEVTSRTDKTGNLFIDGINLFMGTSGIFSIRNNTDIHPLAQISALGRSMVESAIRNFGASIGMQIGGGLLGLGASGESSIGQLSKFLTTIAQASMLIGFILYYVVPFMPFLYFFFAMGGWVKTIFEAIIAMPLWALAHLTVAGEGMAGEAASKGYYLIFEIALRPVLIFIGLIGSIMVFSAMVHVLNGVFDILVLNVSGNDLKEQSPENIQFYRAAIDRFFFTIMHTIIVYMLGLSCFKMIDLVPHQLMRWMGFSTPTFQEGDKGSVEKMPGQIYSTSNITFNKLGGGQIAGLIGR